MDYEDDESIAADKEVVLVLRIIIAVVTCLACLIALCLTTVYHLAFLSTDLVFVIIFPQLTICLYFSNHTNAYGSFFAYIYGLTMRLFAGEPHFGIPCLIKFPLFDYEHHSQGFPYRTTIMITSAILFFLASMLAEYLFVTKAVISPKFDFLRAFPEIWPVETMTADGRIKLRVPSQYPDGNYPAGQRPSKLRLILEH